MKPTTFFTLLLVLSAGLSANAQTPTTAKHRICVDVAHQQQFWGDPADMDDKRVARVKYMTEELVKTAAAVDGSLSYLKKEITPSHLKGCNLVSIHIPSAKYTAGEASAITKFIRGGGSLFLVMDQDSGRRWSRRTSTT